MKASIHPSIRTESNGTSRDNPTPFLSQIRPLQCESQVRGAEKPRLAERGAISENGRSGIVIVGIATKERDR
jgi:hypothetical protein